MWRHVVVAVLVCGLFADLSAQYSTASSTLASSASTAGAAVASTNSVTSSSSAVTSSSTTGPAAASTNAVTSSSSAVTSSSSAGPAAASTNAVTSSSSAVTSSSSAGPIAASTNPVTSSTNAGSTANLVTSSTIAGSTANPVTSSSSAALTAAGNPVTSSTNTTANTATNALSSQSSYESTLVGTASTAASNNTAVSSPSGPTTASNTSTVLSTTGPQPATPSNTTVQALFAAVSTTAPGGATPAEGSGGGSGDGPSGSTTGPLRVVQVTGSSGTITSPNYPGNYGNQQDYRIQITVTASKVIQLTFLTFNMESGWDYVYVYDGNITAAAYQKGRYSGDSIPPVVTSTGSTMMVRLTSDYSVQRQGFKASYTAITKVYVTCSLGEYRCGDGVTCIEFWKRCNGAVDCNDGSDEANCACRAVPPGFTLCRVLQYANMALPNIYNHDSVPKIQTSAQFGNLSALADSDCHPRVDELVCSFLMPQCNGSRQQLPCRSWCEEVRRTCFKERVQLVITGSVGDYLSAFPDCSIFPNTGCYNIPPSMKGSDECYRGNGANYRGGVKEVPSGKSCERWDLDTHRSLLTRYPWANLQENYCRNPDGWERPWCYVEGGFEECDIIPCDVVGCSEPGKPTFGQRTPLLKFYKDGDRITFTCDRGYKFSMNSAPNRAQCVANDTAARWSSGLPTCEVDQHAKLVKDLFNSDVYSKAFAPSRGKVVSIHTYIENVINLDEKNEQIITAIKAAMMWEDERLKWVPSEFGNTNYIYVADAQVWKPTLTLRRNFNTEYTGGFPSAEVKVNHDGTILWTIEFLASTKCDLNPFLFPMDNMTCPICLRGGQDTRIVCASDVSDPDDTNFLHCNKSSAFIADGEWSGQVTLSTTKNLACLTVRIKRDPKYHYATTISPCIILVVLMVITFIMPIDKGDRIGFGVTVLLSMVVSLVVVTSFLPVKGTLPFIAMLIIVAMGLMGGFMMVTLFIIIIHDKKGTLPAWVRTVFLRYVARALFMGDLTRKLRGKDPHGDDDDGVDVTICNNWSANIKVHPDTANGNEDTTRPSVRAQNEVGSNFGGLQGTLDELKTSVRQLSGSIDALAKATSGEEEEKTEYNLLAYVLDRICLFLYIAAIITAIPCTLYVGR